MATNEKILVTGATGFIGTRLVQAATGAVRWITRAWNWSAAT